MNNPNNNSKTPLIIIVVVLIASLGGAWWLLNRPKTSAPKANTSNSLPANNTPRQDLSKAPSGAQPPNMLGSPTATVTIEEFADFQCGACANVHPVLKNVQSAYGSNIKFIFRHFPLQMHRNAYEAAVAAEAAGLQGKFWDMQNLIFNNQQSWAGASDVREIFAGYAEKLGLNVEKFRNDMLGTVTRNRVDADMQRGRALNITSTPTVFVNGQSVPYDQMTLEGMKRIIDAELQKNKTGQDVQIPKNSASLPAANKPDSANKGN